MDKFGSDYKCKNITTVNKLQNYSHRQLLGWIRSTLNLNVATVESLCSGCVPGRKIKWEATQQHIYISNLKLLQNSFALIGCNKIVPIPQLILGKYRDNLEFLQWFKHFFDANNLECDADIRIQQNKASKLLLKKNKKPTPAGYVRPPAVECQPTPRNKLTVLKLQHDCKREKIDALTQERNFLFEKLQRVEAICVRNSEAVSGYQVGSLTSKILAKLHETEEGFSAPQE